MAGAAQPAKKKQDQVKLLQDKLGQAKSAVIVDYSKLTVKEKTTLLDKVRVAGGQFLVAKNSLMHIAFGKKAELKDSFSGMNGVLFSYEDAIMPIKAVMEFKKATEKLIVKKGVMEDKVLSESEVEALSKLPSKAELIAMLISRLQGPSYGLVNVLNAGPRNLVYALQAIATKKEAN
jgi:large subunit ribosomal protein L10